MPSPLKPGDEVATASISSEISEEKAIADGLEIFESWGLVTREVNYIGRYWGYLSGSDLIRYKELHPKKSANLIAFARGGWGAARLLESSQPWRKGLLLGFSDVSSILLSRLSAGFYGGIHGPLLTTLGDEPDWSKERLKNLLFGEEVPDLQGTILKKGISYGHLIATNLTIATHLIGTNHFPNLKGCNLILEDIGEDPYRIDRMLTQWRLAGELQKVGGIGLGSFKDCELAKDSETHKTFKLKEILKDRLSDLNIPIIADLPVGHINGNAALPIGHASKLDGNKGLLSLISS
tara:strand:- start:295 stop:1173 length:879 start_codon:yes stop_codon:yes gene_type:complete